MITVTQKIETEVSKFSYGSTFRYEQLPIEPQEFFAATKAVERLIAKGIIKRISTGIFYKPKKTIFGELKPSEQEVLKPYLFRKGKRIAYITGTSLYNRLGLTTQIPKNIKIANKNKRITISNEIVKASPIKSYVNVTDDNFYLLELLDVLKDFKKIPDLDKESAITIIIQKLKNLNQKEVKLLIKYSLAYPPRVIAFLGALLEKMFTKYDLSTLQKSLNPLSEYAYGINKDLLPTAENWKIK